jgi:dephospho-CoA kinase
MYEVVKAQIEDYRRQGVGVIVLEAPLLIEGGWTSLVDEVWVTVASEATVLRRLKERGLSESEVLSRLRSQLPVEEKVKQADIVINNDGDLSDLKTRVGELWRRLQ